MADIRLRIERSIYEYIRLVLVGNNLTPDITSYPNTHEGFQAYQQDLKSISITNGFSVELFNQSSSLDKGLKQVPRIVITHNMYTPGDWGSAPGPLIGPLYEGFFQSKGIDTTAVNLHFTVYIISKTASQERKLTSLLARLFPAHRYIKFYDSTEHFLMELISSNDSPDLQNGLLERSFYCRVPDIFLNEDELLEVIVPIKEITINQYISNYLGLTYKIQ